MEQTTRITGRINPEGISRAVKVAVSIFIASMAQFLLPGLSSAECKEKKPHGMNLCAETSRLTKGIKSKLGAIKGRSPGARPGKAGPVKNRPSVRVGGVKRRQTSIGTNKTASTVLGNRAVLPTRIFAGPDQFPPTGFAAYGILAFRHLATPATKSRHTLICNAYVAALPSAAAISTPLDKQMVTVWPVASDSLAKSLNGKADRGALCDKAIPNYGLVTAQTAIRDLGDSVGLEERSGPFLIAWAPASNKGQPGVPVLIEDLSDITTHEEALRVMRVWAKEIEEKPERWREGFSGASLKTTIRRLADKYGQKIWIAVTGKQE